VVLTCLIFFFGNSDNAALGEQPPRKRNFANLFVVLNFFSLVYLPHFSLELRSPFPFFGFSVKYVVLLPLPRTFKPIPNSPQSSPQPLGSIFYPLLVSQRCFHRYAFFCPIPGFSNCPFLLISALFPCVPPNGDQIRIDSGIFQDRWSFLKSSTHFVSR